MSIKKMLNYFSKKEKPKPRKKKPKYKCFVKFLIEGTWHELEWQGYPEDQKDITNDSLDAVLTQFGEAKDLQKPFRLGGVFLPPKKIDAINVEVREYAY